MTASSGKSGLTRSAAQLIALLLLPWSPVFAAWHLQNFLVLYSDGWPAEQVAGLLTESSLRRIAAAHYNTTMCAISELELVAKAGLRCLLIGSSEGPPDYIGESVTPQLTRALANNPAVWGYYVMDEPDNRNFKRGATFEQLAQRLSDFRAADPNHVPWVNVSSATGSFLSDYMAIVRPDFLSFDLYRWWGKESDWWRGLEAHRDAALKAGVPMMMWIESNSSESRFKAHLPPLPDNATKLRWSVYTCLAYGCKGVQWFIRSTEKEVANLNAELAILGPTLVKLESKQVFHTSKVPKEGRRLPESNWYFTDTKDLVIGEFVSPDEPRASYLLVTNKSTDGDSDAVIDFRQHPGLTVEEFNKHSSGRTALALTRQGSTARARLRLSAGDGQLIRVETGGNTGP